MRALLSLFIDQAFLNMKLQGKMYFYINLTLKVRMLDATETKAGIIV